MAAMADYCKHELDPATCGPCRQGPRRTPTPVGLPTSSLLEARFHSSCPGCSHHIKPGDIIGKLDEQWLCEGCLEEAGLQRAMQPR